MITLEVVVVRLYLALTTGHISRSRMQIFPLLLGLCEAASRLLLLYYAKLFAAVLLRVSRTPLSLSLFTLSLPTAEFNLVFFWQQVW